MDFDVNAAKAAGHTDEDIARIQKGIAAARAAGRTDDEIQQYLQSEESGGSSAQADATAETNAAAGLGDTGVSGADLLGADLLGAGKSFVRGVGRGFANIPEPSDVITGITNIPKRLTNSANAAAQAYAPGVDPTNFGQPTSGPEGWNSPPPLPVELNKNPDHLGVSENYNKDFPTDPNHPFADVVGQVAGPAIVEGALTGGASIPGQAAGLGRALVTTTGSLVGGEAGGAIDRSLGGSGEFGSFVGGGIGGGFTPGLIKQAPVKIASKIFTDEDTPAKVAALDRVNSLLPPERQIPISAGLVGSGVARRAEDLTATVPGGGGPVYDTRAAQHLGIDTAGQVISARMRGEPSAPAGINVNTMGQRVQDTAKVAGTNATAAQNAAYRPVFDAAGRDTVLDQAQQLAEMEAIRRGAQPTYRDPIERRIDEVNTSRLDPLNPPKVVDPAREASLQAQLARAQANLVASTPGSPLRTAAQQSVDNLNYMINSNRGQTLNEIVETRSDLGRRIEGQQPLRARDLISTKKTMTDTLRRGTEAAGVDPATFTDAESEFGRIARQKRDLSKMADASGQDSAYNQLFTGGSAQNTNRLLALHEHAPDDLRQVLADRFETMFRGKGAGLPPSAESVGPSIKTAPAAWRGLPVETRQLTAGHESNLGPVQTLHNYDDAAALSAVMDADALRPNRTSPSASRSTINSGNVFHTLPSILCGAAGFHFGGFPGAIAASTVPAAAANIFGRGLTNDSLIRRVIAARDQGWINDPNSLSRIMAAAYGGGQSNQ